MFESKGPEVTINTIWVKAAHENQENMQIVIILLNWPKAGAFVTKQMPHTYTVNGKSNVTFRVQWVHGLSGRSLSVSVSTTEGAVKSTRVSDRIQPAHFFRIGFPQWTLLTHSMGIIIIIIFILTRLVPLRSKTSFTSGLIWPRGRQHSYNKTINNR